MNTLTLTALLTVALGALYVALIIAVIRQRRSTGVAFDDGGDQALRGAIRAQMNASEQIPLFVIAFALAEWRGTWSWWLILIGLVFLGGRLINAYGMSRGIFRWRVIGTVANLNAFIFTLLTVLLTLF